MPPATFAAPAAVPAAPAAAGFRPRTVLEVMGAVIVLLRRNHRVFLTIGAVGFLPVFVFTRLVMPPLHALRWSLPYQTGDALWRVMEVLRVLAGGVWLLLFGAAVTLAAADAFLGRSILPLETFRRVVPLGRRLVAAGVLRALAIMAPMAGAVALGAAVGMHQGQRDLFLAVAALVTGAVVGLLAATYLCLALFAVPLVVLVERLPAHAALGRSMALWRGNRWRVFAVMFISVVICSALAAALTILMRALPGGLGTLAELLPAFLAYPLIPAAATVLYFEARIHREHLDLALLAEAPPTPVA